MLRLWVAERQFCDLTQPAALAQGADQFLVRYHSMTPFDPEATRPAQRGQDARGRMTEKCDFAPALVVVPFLCGDLNSARPRQCGRGRLGLIGPTTAGNHADGLAVPTWAVRLPRPRSH